MGESQNQWEKVQLGKPVNQMEVIAMDKRVTIYDVSKKLGVSTATVNRALNGKPKVGEDTRKLIIETAKDMGYKANKAAMSLARKPIKIGFIIDDISHDFNNKIVLGAKKACEDLADFNVTGDFSVVSKLNSRQDLMQKMKKMGESGYDGIIISPTGDLRDYDLVIDELFNRNIPVVTVISDISDSKRLFSVKTNGTVSGKMAEELLWTYAKDKPVAIFTGYKRGVHLENIEGFMMQQREKPLNLVAIYENYDDPNIAYHTTDKLLMDYPDIGGLYIGTANSIMVCKRIVELGMAGRIKIVASDVFPELCEYIKDGVVNATIFQEPFNIGRLAFKYLYEHIAEGKKFDENIQLKPQIVLSSNLELFTEKNI